MKKRMVDTRFWEDNFILNLDKDSKLLFIYLLTNHKTNLVGIYEIAPQTISHETSIPLDKIGEIFKEFEGKISYIDGWVYIHNFYKYQSDSPLVKKGIEREMKEIPERILKKVEKINKNDTLSKGIDTVSEKDDTVSKEYGYGSVYFNLNLDLDSNLSGDVPSVSDVTRSPSQDSDGTQEKDPVGQIMKIFYEHNPAIKFENKTMRRDAEFFIKKIGFANTVNLAKFSVGIQGTSEFAPTVDNPTDMRTKFNAIKRYYEKVKSGEGLTKDKDRVQIV